MSDTADLISVSPSISSSTLGHNGLGILVATIFLTGEMAGSGLLALPATLVGTGMLNRATNYTTVVNFFLQAFLALPSSPSSL
jgi:hypothetical protein